MAGDRDTRYRRPERISATTAPSPDKASLELPESLTNLHFAPGHLFRRAGQFHDALWLQRVGEALTPLQFAVLTALDAEPELNQRELGERVALDKSTVGDLVARLDRRGYLTRRPDPTDRRRRILSVTSAGCVALVRTRPSVANIGQEILHSLDGDERKELIRLLAKLVFSSQAASITVGGQPAPAPSVFCTDVDAEAGGRRASDEVQ